MIGHNVDLYSEEASRRAAIRHSAHARRIAQPRRSHARRNLPRPGVHLRAGQSGHPVPRQGHSGRIRVGALDRHGQPAAAQEDRRADDRRTAVWHVRHAIDGHAAERADHRRVAEAVRGGAGRSEQPDHREVRRAAGRAAFVAHAAAARQLHRGHQERSAHGHLRRPHAMDQSDGAGHQRAQATARRRQSVHAAHSARAQVRHRAIVEAVGRGLQRRERDLAGLQPHAQAGGLRHSRMGVRRLRQRRQEAVQPRQPGDQGTCSKCCSCSQGR